MLSENSVNKILDAIKGKRAAVFCGAGISYDSGLPIVSELLDYIFSKICLTPYQSKKIMENKLPFESIMEMVLRESGLDDIQQIFTAGKPNINHILLAKLAKQGFLNIIYTTNFDLLIEKALEDEGLTPDIDFKVYSSTMDFEEIQWDDSIIKIVKIHGTASKKEEMAITMSLIASAKYTKERRQLLEKIFCAEECDEVIILGYSCSDIDLTQLIESFRGQKSTILLVEHQGAKCDIRSEAISANTVKNIFRHYSGTRLHIDTAELVKFIWKSLLDEEFIYIPNPGISWKANINRWYDKSEEESGTGVKHHIASRLLYAVAEFREAIIHNQESIKIALQSNNLLAYASEIGNMGMAQSAIGENENAKLSLRESLPLCKRMGIFANIIPQLQTYGNILHRTGDDLNALKFHQEALQYAETNNDEECISNVLGDMCNSYNRLGMFDYALIAITTALRLAKKLGNKQAESSQLGIMAVTYLCTGNYDDSLKHCLDGLEMKKMLGDRQGECSLLINLIIIYKYLGKKNEALQVASECLALAKSIGNNQAEQLVVANIMDIT